MFLFSSSSVSKRVFWKKNRAGPILGSSCSVTWNYSKRYEKRSLIVRYLREHWESLPEENVITHILHAHGCTCTRALACTCLNLKSERLLLVSTQSSIWQENESWEIILWVRPINYEIWLISKWSWHPLSKPAETMEDPGARGEGKGREKKNVYVCSTCSAILPCQKGDFFFWLILIPGRFPPPPRFLYY